MRCLRDKAQVQEHTGGARAEPWSVPLPRSRCSWLTRRPRRPCTTSAIGLLTTATSSRLPSATARLLPTTTVLPTTTRGHSSLPATAPPFPAVRALYAPFYAAGLIVRYGFYYGIIAPLEVFGRAINYGVKGGVDERP